MLRTLKKSTFLKLKNYKRKTRNDGQSGYLEMGTERRVEYSRVLRLQKRIEINKNSNQRGQ